MTEILLLLLSDAVQETEAAVDDQSDVPPTLEAAVAEQAHVRELLDAASAVKSALEKRHDWLRTAVVPPKMEERDITTITIKDIGRVSLTDDVFVSIPTERKADAWQWFEDHGFGDLISRTINGSTLAAWVRRRIKKGEELPEAELVRVTPYTRATITKV